jgi:hypothetical protein
MPLQSKAQERFMWSQHPDLAQKFEDETPEDKKLPEKKRRGSARTSLKRKHPFHKKR